MACRAQVQTINLPNDKVFKETLMTEDDKHLGEDNEDQVRVGRAGTEQLTKGRRMAHRGR